MTTRAPKPSEEDPAEPDPTGRDPAALLAELLESATPEVRRQITGWLLSQRPAAGAHTAAPSAFGVPWLPPIGALTPSSPHSSQGDIVERVHRLAGQLPAGTDSQLVTLRLPAQRHAALREWCSGHGFSMAAVVRGLVERFLEEQTSS